MNRSGHVCDAARMTIDTYRERVTTRARIVSIHAEGVLVQPLGSSAVLLTSTAAVAEAVGSVVGDDVRIKGVIERAVADGSALGGRLDSFTAYRDDDAYEAFGEWLQVNAGQICSASEVKQRRCGQRTLALR